MITQQIFSPRHGAALASVLLTFTLSLAAPVLADPPGVPPADVPAVADTPVPVNTPVPMVLVTGTSEVVEHGVRLQRVSIANPDIADAVVVSATEIIINAKAPGQTTLLLWDAEGGRARRDIQVTVDAPSIQSQLDLLFPDTDLMATASGATIILSGTAHDPGLEARAMTLATTLAGDTPVLNQIFVPERGQIMLKVRFAEVDRSALNEWGLEAYAYNGTDVATGIGSGQFFRPSDDPASLIETSQDAVNFFLFHRPSDVMVFMRALQGRGLLRSLAEPTLMAIPGEEASFLAGGEFPFPVLQGGVGGVGGAITIQFKEFGIRLRFVPTITNSGAIRIETAPEVSQLDFTQGLEVSGFRVPALLTRRAETIIELETGQTFAIAGLVDNSLAKQVNKIPLLGDIPILGKLFQSEEIRQNRAELLVLVTPHLVRPADGPPPPVPTGEPETWEGIEEIQNPKGQQQDPDGDGKTDPDGPGGRR